MSLDEKTEENLAKNHEFAKKNLKDLLEKFPNKFVLINDQKIIDVYDTLKEAAENGFKRFGYDSGLCIYEAVEPGYDILAEDY